MTETSHLYFQRRAAEERTAATLASHPLARRRHLELAQHYEEAAAENRQVLEDNVAARLSSGVRV